MKLTYTIDVTGEDILNGIPHCAYGCPLALAAQRTFADEGTITWAYNSGSLYYGPLEDRMALILPVDKGLAARIYDWVDNFDSGRMGEPFSFEAKLWTPKGELILCSVCNFPIEPGATFRGTGNGFGSDFAHEDCYWRSEAERYKDALRLYGRHDSECKLMGPGDYCTCGLDILNHL